MVIWAWNNYCVISKSDSTLIKITRFKASQKCSHGLRIETNYLDHFLIITVNEQTFCTVSCPKVLSMATNLFHHFLKQLNNKVMQHEAKMSDSLIGIALEEVPLIQRLLKEFVGWSGLRKFLFFYHSHWVSNCDQFCSASITKHHSWLTSSKFESQLNSFAHLCCN